MSTADSDFLKTIEEIISIMVEDPSSIDRKDLEQGTQLLAIYEDANYPSQYKNYRTVKEEILREAIIDISRGAPRLALGQLGVLIDNNRLSTYYVHHDESPDGSVVYSIALRKLLAFKNYRNQDSTEIPQEELNMMVYKLVHCLAQLRKS